MFKVFVLIMLSGLLAWGCAQTEYLYSGQQLFVVNKCHIPESFGSYPDAKNKPTWPVVLQDGQGNLVISCQGSK